MFTTSLNSAHYRAVQTTTITGHCSSIFCYKSRVVRVLQTATDSEPIQSYVDIQSRIGDLEMRVRRFYAVKPLELQEIIYSLRLKRGKERNDLMKRALALVKHVSGVQTEVHLLMATLCLNPESMEYAPALLNNMKKRRIGITTDTYDLILGGLSKWRHLQSAKELLTDYERFCSSQPDATPSASCLKVVTLCSLIRAFAQADDLVTVRKLWGRIQQERLTPTPEATRAIMDIQLDRRNYSEVASIFEYFVNTGSQPDSEVFSLMASAMATVSVKPFWLFSLTLLLERFGQVRRNHIKSAAAGDEGETG